MGDMETIDRVLDYINDTYELGLVLGELDGFKRFATVDASYGNPDDRKSHSGCTLHFGAGFSAFLSWSNKKMI